MSALYAVRAGGKGHVGAIVHDEPGAVPSGRLTQRRREMEEITNRQGLLTELHAAKSGGEAGLHNLGKRAARLLPIGDEIEGEAGLAAQLVLQSGTPSIGDDAVA